MAFQCLAVSMDSALPITDIISYYTQSVQIICPTRSAARQPGSQTLTSTFGSLHPSLPNSSGSQFLLQPISWHFQSFQTMVTLGLAFPSNLQLLIQSEEIFFTNCSVYKKYRKFLPIRAIKIVFMLKYGMHDHFY